MRLPWDLKPAEQTLTKYEALYGADHSEVVHLRRCIDACRRKYAKLPPIECLFLDHAAGIYPEWLWERGEQDLLWALVFFCPEAGSRSLATPDLAAEMPEGRPH